MYLSKQFQSALLSSILRRPKFGTHVLEFVEPSHFYDTKLSDIYAKIRKHYRKYKEIPTSMVLIEEMAEEFEETIEVLFDEELESEDYLRDKVATFCRMGECMRIAFEISEKVEKGQDIEDSVLDEMNKALRIGELNDDLGLFIREDMEERIRNMKEAPKERIPTGYEHLDELLGGGVARGEFHVFAGLPKAGKSMLLAGAALGIAKRTSGYNVVYYSLEMSDFQVGQRVDKLVIPGDATEKEEVINTRFDSVESYMEHVKKAYASCLSHDKDILIKRYPDGEASVETLLNHFQKLKEIGFHPDVVIVDYADNCKLPKADRHDLQLVELFRKLRAFAVNENVGMISATQRNAMGSKEKGTALHQIAGAFQKVAIVDGLYFIDQTEAEKEDRVGRLVPTIREPAIPVRDILMTLDYSRGIIRTDGFKNTKKVRDNKDKIDKNKKKQEKMLQVIKEGQAERNKRKREAPKLLDVVLGEQE